MVSAKKDLQIDVDSIEAQHKGSHKQNDNEDDYNNLSEIQDIKCEPLPAYQQNDKTVKAHKMFKFIIIGDTGKYKCN